MGTALDKILYYVSSENAEYLSKSQVIQLLVQGFDINNEMEQYLEVLLREDTLQADVAHLVDLIMSNRGISFFAIASFREERLKESSITWEEFVLDFKTNCVQAMTSLFIEPMNDWKMDKVFSKFKAGTITLKSLFELHLIQPHSRLMSFLL